MKKVFFVFAFLFVLMVGTASADLAAHALDGTWAGQVTVTDLGNGYSYSQTVEFGLVTDDYGDGTFTITGLGSGTLDYDGSGGYTGSFGSYPYTASVTFTATGFNFTASAAGGGVVVTSASVTLDSILSTMTLLAFYTDYTGTNPHSYMVAGSLAKTPIPGAVWLLGTGLAGLVGLRKRIFA